MRILPLRHLSGGLLVLICLISPIHTALASAPVASSSVAVIGEIAWAGSSASIADEWLELWNLTNESLSLSGWRLLGAGGTDGIGLSFGINDTIMAHSAFLIANYSNTDVKSVLAAPPSMVTTTLSLANDKSFIQLLDSHGFVIDQAGNGATPFAGSSGTPKASMLRLSPLADGGLKEAWQTATSSSGFDIGSAELGTPGLIDFALIHATTTPAQNFDSSAPSTTSTAETEPAPAPPVESTSTETLTSDPSPLDTSVVDESATSSSDLLFDQNIEPKEIAPQYPVAQVHIQGNFIVGEPISFDATSSSDPNGDPLFFAWDFGDGLSTTSSQVTHTYTTSGPWIVSLRVSDGTFSQTATTSIRLTSQNIVAAASQTQNVSEAALRNNMTNIELNELFPHPSSGSEWVELFSPEGWSKNLMDGLVIEDALGPLLRVTSSTVIQTSSTNLIVLALPTQRLNNDGDTVRLRAPDGSLIDQISYPSIERDAVWARNPQHSNLWYKAKIATPGQPNAIEPDPPTPITPSPPAPTIITSPKITVTKTKTIPTTIPTPKTIAPSGKTTTEDIPLSIQTSTPQIKPTKTATTSLKKASTNIPKPTHPSPPLRSTDIAMLSSLTSDTRVRITGVVGSIPKLLASRQFILQSENGQGLLILGNTKQPTPPFGSKIQLTGTLIINDSGTSLHMLARDSWNVLQKEAKIQPRIVDFSALMNEDAWSLLNVTGTVQNVTQSTIELNVDDTTLKAIIKPVIKYRAQRLKVGDTINVQGLLDMRTDETKIYPRSAEEISIVARAKPPKQDQPPQDGLPPWAPIGSAGATVAAAQGFKYYRKRREQHRLAGLLKETELALTDAI